MNAALRLTAIAVAAASTALADTQHFTSYRVRLQFGQPVTDIMMFEASEGGSGTTWAFTAGGQDETVLSNPFPHSEPVTSSLLIGLVRDLPNDPPGQVHAVLLMDPQAAQLSNHIAWGTLFRHTLEEQLIAAIELATSGQDWPIIQPGLDFVHGFVNGDAVDGILGPGGVPYSAWFATGGAFTVMAFSEGTVIGDGVSETIEVPVGCPGDADADGTIDLTDLAILLTNFGMPEDAAFEQGDFDGDADVDLVDLATLLIVYGGDCP